MISKNIVFDVIFLTYTNKGQLLHIFFHKASLIKVKTSILQYVYK